MSDKQKLHICRVTKQEHLPAGYERIAAFAGDVTEDQRKNFSNYVVRAVHRGCFDNGDDLVNAPFCLGGKAGNYHGGTFYLHPQDLQRLRSDFVEERDSSLESSSNQLDVGLQYESAVTALCEINNGIVLLNATLRDVVAAVGLVAEQLQKQNEPVGSWRDMNGEAMN